MITNDAFTIGLIQNDIFLDESFLIIFFKPENL